MGNETRRSIDSVLNIAPNPDRPAISLDVFEQQQKILLDSQERALRIQTEQMEKVLCLSTVAASKSHEMLQVILQASADLAAQAVNNAEQARANAEQARANARESAEQARASAQEASQAREESAKANVNPLIDGLIAFLKEKGLIQ